MKSWLQPSLWLRSTQGSRATTHYPWQCWPWGSLRVFLVEVLRNLILGIEIGSLEIDQTPPLIWACTLCVMHPSCFGSFKQSSLLRAAFHQTLNDVALFDHVPAFTSVALACHQCISGLWMTPFHWADCSGLILRRGVGFLRWMYSCSLFTHWKILGVYGCHEAWPLAPYTWRSAFEQISWLFAVGPLFLVYFASFTFWKLDITCEWGCAVEFKECKRCARQLSFARCCPALRQQEVSSRFLLCSACLPWGSTGICEDSQLYFLVSSPACLHVLRQFLMKYLWPPLWPSVSTFVSFPSFKVCRLFGMPIFLLVLIFVAISNSEEKCVFFTTESTSPLLKAAQNVKISHIYSTQLLQQTLFGSNGACVAHAYPQLVKTWEKETKREMKTNRGERRWGSVAQNHIGSPGQGFDERNVSELLTNHEEGH